MLSAEEHRDSVEDQEEKPIDFKFLSRQETMSQVKLQTLEIILHDNQINYETGDTVIGKCVIAIEGRIRRSMINILFTCVGTIKWYQQGPHSRYHNSHTVQEFSDKRVFMELLYKHPDECENEFLESGVHSIDFEFELPRGVGLPSTFQGLHGSICYFLEASISEDVKLPPLFRTEPLVVCVAAPIRTNLWLPVGTDAEKEVGYINPALVHLYASLAKKGFYPGEKIRLDLVTVNDSSSTVTPRATLYCTKVFMTKNRHHSIEQHFEAVKGKDVARGQPGLDQLFLEIPESCPLTIKNELIVFKYFIHITLDIPMELDLHINIPIIITTKRALEETRGSPKSRHTSLDASFEIND